MQRHVAIAVPAYTGTVTIPTLSSLLADCLALQKHGVGLSFINEVGNTDIEDARALVAKEFLEIQTATDLVFIDHDVTWERGALLRLLAHEVDLVAGAYPKRIEPLTYPVRWMTEGEPARTDSGLVEVEGVPAGFMRISRVCLERMAERYSDLRYVRGAPPQEIIGLFDRMRLDNGSKLSEDLSFCHRWRQIGGKVWLDPSFTMGHIGLKNYAGCVGRDLLTPKQGNSA